MRRVRLVVLGGAIVLASLAVVIFTYLRVTTLESLSTPGPFEARLARTARRLAVPASVRNRNSPVPASPEALADGMTHYADHCASCHANDGSGETELGRGLYPKAPDMRLRATQDLSDGELFYVIENGIRFTGMPGWRTGTGAGEEASWKLVQFVRHLPRLTESEMEAMRALNPRSPEDVRQEIEEERFLNQGAQ
jgi:mono/diheme cytochrome c family protein